MSQGSRLPPDIIHRKKKGFNAPVAHWLLNGLEKDIFNMQKDNVLFAELIDCAQINQLLKDHVAKKADNSFKLFTALNFGLWLKQYPDLAVDC